MRISSVFLTVAMLIQLPCASVENKPKPESHVTFISPVLRQPIAGIYRYTISGDLNGQGRVVLQSMPCLDNDPWNREDCIISNLTTVEVKFSRIELTNETENSARLYRIDGELPPEGYDFIIAISDNRDAPHHLVLQKDNSEIRKVELSQTKSCR